MSIAATSILCRVLAGEFRVVCPWLLRELVDLKLWNDDMKNRIIANNGSKVLDLAADRDAFIYQSRSLNVRLQVPTTDMYYLRTRPAAQETQFTRDHSLVAQVKEQKEQQEAQPITKPPVPSTPACPLSYSSTSTPTTATPSGSAPASPQ
ncbi:hypothetical protein DFH94DRAFT_857404 [Russula ochroleuca]|uniref:Uncharacterized protein n=1 Tax=Russula ochroleuca TaxID=152965 RepID=A0A9P5JVF4_9AGAM|nr:hypothetical protein DFH94DRAFT_857404 [Russula ochroleuca]